MQQEDDLRGLAKVMDFMRAVSIILVVMNVYWYCYATIVDWHIQMGIVDPASLLTLTVRQDYSTLFFTPNCFLFCCWLYRVSEPKE